MLLQQFKDNWLQKGFAQPQQAVLLAVSGGADSMAMASLFLQSNIRFAVAHCNFQLRGKESDIDEELVKQWCETNHITCHVVRFDTSVKVTEWKKGIQETARILRYEWLEMIREQNHYVKIATAHHANDNVETLLINLFRGTGISGLHGIPEVNDKIIRPLLFTSRSELRSYIAENNIPYREDASNATDNYLRNEIRHNIIPVVEQWLPNAIQNVNNSIRRFTQAETIYQNAIASERKKLLELRGQDLYIPLLKLRKRQPLETILYELLEPFGFSSAQLPQILQLMESESGHYLSSATHRIIRNRNFFILTETPTAHTDFITIDAVPCVINTGTHHFSFSIENKPATIPTGNDIACIDMKHLTFPLILRKWSTGDYFYPIGMGMKKKKVSRYFIDQKVPVHLKEQAWILECQKRIAWVAGMRLDERFKITDGTQEVLMVRLKQA